MNTPQQLIRPEILDLSAYHVQPAAGYVKLDAMENPFGLPDALRAELGALAGNAPLNRYPDAGAAALKQRLREALDLPAQCDLLLGNGSDEIIQIVALALARPGACLLALEPSFVMYRMIATFCGMRYVGVPLNADFTLDRAALLDAVRREQPALVFIAYPNNPTGNLFARDDLLELLAVAPGVVVMDEAYHAFAQDSFMGELARHPNLLVMRTLSKLGLAGLRLGFMAAAPEWIGQFDKLRLPYNINVLTQLLAGQVLRDVDVLNAQASLLRIERARLAGALAALGGVEVFPSSTNFILFRVAGAAGVFAALKSRNILIKCLHGAHPLLADCLRVTVGAPQENDAFMAALVASLAAAAA
ncbi:MAG: histidinol-phosphate transaminase [Rhodocyclaceae bacterium]|nr:histidinol-phosphate transaminase [Rhodocyclaceae bacterium]MBX3669318.1 histidinol-phosphate transaminase [Rhodocyclaceae bacterium]